MDNLYDLKDMLGGGTLRLHFKRHDEYFVVSEHTRGYQITYDGKVFIFKTPKDVRNWLERMEQVQA